MKSDVFKNKVSLNNMIDLREGMKRAEQDDTPFPVVTDDGVNVVGDANKTEVKSHNYTVRFRFPKEMEDQFDPEDIIARVGDYFIVSVDFDNVHIIPRRDTEIASAIVKIIPYLKALDENGGIRYKNNEELLAMVKQVNHDIGNDCYDTVAAVLDVDDERKNYMIMTDVMDVLTKLPEDFPEIFNESDSFFG